MNSPLGEIHLHHQGKISDRWKSYLDNYSRLFDMRRNDPIRLLEIGIQNGGSLEIWAEYFPVATLLLGCDVNPLCGKLSFKDQRIAVVVENACSVDGAQKIKYYSSSFDFVIDDGSHRSGDIVVAFSKYFPMILEGGIFIAEDLHCSYWREFVGGLVDPFSAMTFFKRLADVVNHEHWGVPVSREDYLRSISTHYGCEFSEELLAQIHSIEFANSMCMVHKRSAPDNALGPRSIVGKFETVSSNAREYAGTFSLALNQANNTGADPYRFAWPVETVQSEQLLELSHKCAELQSCIVQLERAVIGRDEVISRIAADKAHDQLAMQRQADDYRAYAASLIATIQARDDQLKELLALQGSHASRFAQLLESSSKKLFPMRSIRRQALAGSLRFGYRVYRFGLRGALKLSFAPGGPPDLEPATAGQVVEPDARAQPPEYAEWIRHNEPDSSELEAQRKTSPPYQPAAPLFSVLLPVYKVPPGVLRATLASLTHQSWQNWEACVVYADTDDDSNYRLLEQHAADDPRIKLRKLERNGGISLNSNAALEMAIGEFVALLDHDDELTPWALHDIAQCILTLPDADFLYSDKDSINASGSLRQSPLFKPKWSPEMLYSVNYLTHLNVMRRAVVRRVGGWRSETDGAQDWDLFLRVIESSRQVERVESIGYHWRIIEGSTSTGIGAKPYAALGQLRTLEARVKRLGLAAAVLPDPDSGFRLVWIAAPKPCIDVLLHGKTDAAGLAKVIAWLADENSELISSISLVHDAKAALKGNVDRLPGGIEIQEFLVESESGMASAMHCATQAGQGTVLLFVDLAVSEVARGTLRELAGWVGLHQEIAFAGALLMTRGDTVVESGRIVGEGFSTLPLFRGTALRHWGPLGGPLWFRNVSAVSPTAAAFKRSAWHLANWLHLDWQEAFVRCCASATKEGLRGMVSPHARAYVDSMPSEPSAQWHSSFGKDPYFHPAFSSVMPLTISNLPQ